MTESHFFANHFYYRTVKVKLFNAAAHKVMFYICSVYKTLNIYFEQFHEKIRTSTFF